MNLGDGELDGVGRKAIDVGTGIAEQGALVELVSSLDLAVHIGSQPRHGEAELVAEAASPCWYYGRLYIDFSALPHRSKGAGESSPAAA